MTATATTTNPSQKLAKDGIRETSKSPKPKPKRLWYIACGVKHSFIFAFIFLTSKHLKNINNVAVP